MDSDDDGVSDGDEVNTYGSDPLDSDTDDGGIDDGAEVLIEIAGDTYQVGEGQVIRLPGGVPHAVQAEQRFKMLLVMIRS